MTRAVTALSGSVASGKVVSGNDRAVKTCYACFHVFFA